MCEFCPVSGPCSDPRCDNRADGPYRSFVVENGLRKGDRRDTGNPQGQSFREYVYGRRQHARQARRAAFSALVVASCALAFAALVLVAAFS